MARTITEQPSLFDGDAPVAPVRLDLPDADVVLHPAFLPDERADRLFRELIDAVSWRQEVLRIHGKEVPVPRLSAWYGDPGTTYAYSRIRHEPNPWIAPLTEVRAVAERVADAPLNCVLANLYRDGADSVAWHADDEPELGPEPVIASVSLGATRRFQMRRRDDSMERVDLELAHGSFLVMRGVTQRHWVHQIPKTARPVGPRINLTFRHIARATHSEVQRRSAATRAKRRRVSVSG